MVKRQRNSLPSRSVPQPSEKKLYTSVRLSEVVEAGLRLEASAYNVAARNAIAALLDAGLALIPLYGEGGLCEKASIPYRLKRVYVRPDRGISFLTSAEIISMRPRIDHYISRRLTAKLENLTIKKWDVLISRSGTIGNISLAGDTFVGKALSEDAIRLTAPDAETAGYITAFLRSRLGRPQLRQATYGSVIVHIEPEHLSHLLIPDLPPIRRIAIGLLMREATELRDQANALLDEADRLLHKRLHLSSLKDSRSDGPLTARIKASTLEGRLEASYHSLPAITALKRLKRLKVPLATLGNPQVSKEVRAITKFRKRVYVSHGGIPLLGGKQLFQVDPVDVKGLAKGAHTKDLKEIQLAENMIMVTRSGTVGRVQIVPAYMNQWAGSEDAHRVLAAEGMNPGYLFAWLASDYGSCLMERYTYGSVILKIDREMLAAVPIPLPDATVINEIGNMILQANIHRDEAWRKEQEAIRQIEALAEAISV
jgi:type I restriction enzyme S subunit